jgi:hypothetical protein
VSIGNRLDRALKALTFEDTKVVLELLEYLEKTDQCGASGEGALVSEGAPGGL